MNTSIATFNSPKSVINLIDSYISKSGVDPDLPGAVRHFFGEMHTDQIHHFKAAAVKMLALLASPEMGSAIQHKMGSQDYSHLLSLMQGVVGFSESILEPQSLALIDRNLVECEELPGYKIDSLASKYTRLLSSL